MPKNKFQDVIYTIIMASVMVYGMVIKTRRTERRVPCKLNNVTNEKHQIWIWLFEDKRSLKRMTVNFFEAWKSFDNMI